MVSSTDGSPTYTCWNRRSRAASFSMCFLYSLSVVAPMQRSSPRARAGLSMFDASTAPSAAPAPMMVWSSSMNRTISPSGLADLLEDGLEPVLELAPVLRPGDERADVEGEEPLVLQGLGDVAVGDAPGQPLDDGGLPDARLADEDGIVLRPPGQDLDDAPDLVLAADDRVELPLPGQGGEVAGVLLQGLELGLGLGIGDPLRAADRGQGLEDGVLGDAPRPQDPAGVVGLVLEHGQEEVLGGDVLVLERRGLLLGPVHDAPQGLGHDRALRPPETLGRRASSASRSARTAAGFAPILPRTALTTFSSRSRKLEQKMLGTDLLVPQLPRLRLRVAEGLLRHDRQFFPSHGRPPFIQK